MTDCQFHFGLAPAMTKLSWGHRDRDPVLAMPREIRIACARNEVIGAQVFLVSSQDTILTLDPTNWLHPLGFTPRVRFAVRWDSLPSHAVETFTVGYLEGDDRRQWMESLDRSGYALVPAHRPQAAYIRLRIPKDLPPGDHIGRVLAYIQMGFEDEQLAWEGTIRLQVADVTLPDPVEWSFHLDLWQHDTAIARQHRVPLWSDAHFHLIDRYFASLAQLGQKAVTIVATELPWSGQRCFRDPEYPSPLYEHAAIDVYRNSDGHLEFDYTKLDRLLELARRHGIDREIEIFGLLNIWVDPEFGFGSVVPDAPDAIRIRCYDRSTQTITYLRTAGELHQFIRALHDHLANRHLLSRVRIAADEPSDLSAFNARLNFVKAAGPGFRYKVAINHFEFMQAAPAEVVDYVPVLPLACRDPDLTQRLTEQLHARDGKMLWYDCCWPPIPNLFLHSPLVEGQLHGWLTFFLNLDGFLRWNFCLWPADPWQRPSWRAPHWSAGDMFFVLPGSDGGPVETLRYEALRAAVQDYELLRLAQRTLSPEAAQAVFKAAFGQILHTEDIADFVHVGASSRAPVADDLYSLNPLDYHAARVTVLAAIAESNPTPVTQSQARRD